MVIVKVQAEGTECPAALNINRPTKTDLVQTDELIQVLGSSGAYSSEEEGRKRHAAIHEVELMFNCWVNDLSVSRFHMVEKGKVVPFGSYRLGVDGEGADIDILCVAPKQIYRTDFFTTFPEVLKGHELVTGVQAVENAFVPIIKLQLNGIDIDLTFVRLNQYQIPEDIELDNPDILIGLDPRCLRSLNGLIVTDQILNSVPNEENFKVTLRTIKLWAKKHGIYNNSLGYLGGVSWAILVARTCQLYPNAAPARLVQKFFFIYFQWRWPAPIMLRGFSNMNLGFPVWNPKINMKDRAHLMPVITPAYPEQNSTFNVTVSSKTVIMEEMKRGFLLASDVLDGKSTWIKLFEPSQFLTAYNHFLVLMTTAATSEELDCWSGFVQSRIRHLIGQLEGIENVKYAHINPTPYDYVGCEISLRGNIKQWVIGLDLKPMTGLDLNNDYTTLNLRNTSDKFITCIFEQSSRLKLWQEGMTIDIKSIKRKDLPLYISKELLYMEYRLFTNRNVLSAKRKRKKKDNELDNVKKYKSS